VEKVSGRMTFMKTWLGVRRKLSTDEERRAQPLSFQINKRWKSAMMAMNSEPTPLLIVVGGKAFQTILADMGGGEEGDAWAESVAFLDKLRVIDEDNDRGCD